MKQQFTCTLLNQRITAEVKHIGPDLQVDIWGGNLPHIGSVTVAVPSGDNIQLEKWVGAGHRDDIICDKFAQALAQASGSIVCVACGIHYDGLTKGGIQAVVASTDGLLDEIFDALFP